MSIFILFRTIFLMLKYNPYILFIFLFFMIYRIIFVNPLVDTLFIIEAPLFEVLMLTVR